MNKGKFIVLEGLDYSGKTTLARNLTEYLNDIGIKTIHASCSGEDNPLSQLVRKHILDMDELPSVDTQAMLYGACINDLVDKVLLPNLNAGNWVVCERYTLSNKVYQTHSLLTNALASGIERRLQPDLTIVIDITPQVYMARSAQREDKADAMERVPEDIVSQRRKQYRLRVRADEKTISLDGTMSPEELVTASVAYLRKLLS